MVCLFVFFVVGFCFLGLLLGPVLCWFSGFVFGLVFFCFRVFFLRLLISVFFYYFVLLSCFGSLACLCFSFSARRGLFYCCFVLCLWSPGCGFWAGFPCSSAWFSLFLVCFALGMHFFAPPAIGFHFLLVWV